ncbi:MAG: NAD(P)-binding domain-containing protein [Solirubrobacteraceae bacterium]
MQIGFVGLGKMGGNMVHRIKRDSDHDVVAFDPSEEAVGNAKEVGAQGASSLEDLVSQLEQPRTVWVMVPAGDATDSVVNELAGLLEADDVVVDGGNSNWHSHVRRGEKLRKKGINYVDVGVNGRVWGLEVGDGMMVGGTDNGVE